MIVKVEEHEDLVRDLVSGAVLNIDKTAHSLHRANRNRLRNKDVEINELKDRITSIEKILENLGIINGNDNTQTD